MQYKLKLICYMNKITIFFYYERKRLLFIKEVESWKRKD
jgi:hypothetical protein